MRIAFPYYAVPILLLFFMLPLFFLNITGKHGWGGDFSQYIHQAINIVENKAIDDIGYIYNENHPSLAPSAYPVGFPILLAPVYAFFGNSMTVFMIYMTILLCILGGLSYFFFRSEFSILASFLGIFILLYNPWTVGFKSNVLSDIPFTLFFLLSAVFYLFWQNKRFAAVIGFVAGFTILIRPIGYVLLIAIVMDKLIKLILAHYQKNYTVERLKKEVKDGLIIIIAALTVVFLFHEVFFPLPEKNNYTDIITSTTKIDYLSKNVKHYADFTQSYFTLNKTSFLSISSFWVFSFITLLGMIRQKRNTIFLLLLILGIVGIIMLFPYVQGFRYIYPTVPFIIYFFLHGTKKLIPNKKYNQLFLAIYFLITLILYIPKLIAFQKSIDSNHLESGPQAKDAIEAFKYIKENVPEDAILVFNKPRVLSLYTDRSCMGSSFKDPDALHSKFLEKNVDYVLFNTWVASSGTSVHRYVSKYRESHLDSIWSNKRYRLFQLRKE